VRIPVISVTTGWPLTTRLERWTTSSPSGATWPARTLHLLRP